MTVIPAVQHALRKLPARPGVYLFRDEKGGILYVGKAKSLRSRVRSYFRRSASLEPAKRIMVRRIADLEYIIVDSEVEALLLEATLIKKHRPPFNVIFRDDKYYQYIRITLADDFPRVETVRRITKDHSRYFGPYTSGYAVRQTLQLLKRIFPYKNCSEPPAKPCFEARLGRCLGHDLGPGSREQYREVITNLIRFLEGDVDATLRNLRQQMSDAATNRQFELAARLRDRIAAIVSMSSEQKVVSTRLENEDILGLARIADLAIINLFQIRIGKLLHRQFFLLQHTANATDVDILNSFIGLYYPQSTDHPRIVVTRTMPTDAVSLRRTLHLRFEAPSRGKKRRLVILAEANAQDELQRKQREFLSREARGKLGLQELQKALLLTESPSRIECYDVSNIQGANAVGSMVVFIDGLHRKELYRKFKIKTVEGANDYAMLQEVLRRRFGHHRHSSPHRGEARRGDRWPDPDLMIIDGGKGQLNAGLAVLRELDLLIPTIGLAKREELIFRPGLKDPLRLPRDSEGLYFLQRVRDEAHRFAIGYYRKRHGAETTRSLLDEVPGIGPTLKKRLLERFGSIEGIRSADDAAIRQVIGKTRTTLLREHL